MVVITLGGNALLPDVGPGTFAAQQAVADEAMGGVADLIATGVDVILSHGNGPIVGNILIRNEAAKEQVPPMPLDVCGADSQGGIGYMIQQVLGNELVERNVERTVVALVSQTLVDRADPAFERPAKPIGPSYSKEDARRLAEEKQWKLVLGSNGRFRRVVPSPQPIEIVEWPAVAALVAARIVVIVAGGGGVPVVRREDGTLEGVEAVIDKDRSAAVLARRVGAKRMIILTAVPAVALDFGRPTQREVSSMTVDEARRHGAEGQFPPGSMGPKVEACIQFLESGGEEAIITSPDHVLDAYHGRAGTRIVRGSGARSGAGTWVAP